MPPADSWEARAIALGLALMFGAALLLLGL